MNRNRITIRVGQGTLSFSTYSPVSAQDDEKAQPLLNFEPYVVRSGVSIAANLREAFKTSDLLATDAQRARVLTDTPVLMTPMEVFEEQTKDTYYAHAFPDLQHNHVLYNILPDLNAVAVFSINSDLKLVLDDHFRDISFYCALTPVWRHLHQRSFSGVRNKLYGYFHERRLDIFAFQKNRFKFCNQYEANHVKDVLYFLLYVWQQLALDASHDELYLVGDLPEGDELLTKLKEYVRTVRVINPVEEYGESPLTLTKGIPYDLMTLFAKEQ
jgi:hypothetical protein